MVHYAGTPYVWANVRRATRPSADVQRFNDGARAARAASGRDWMRVPWPVSAAALERERCRRASTSRGLHYMPLEPCQINDRNEAIPSVPFTNYVLWLSLRHAVRGSKVLFHTGRRLGTASHADTAHVAFIAVHARVTRPLRLAGPRTRRWAWSTWAPPCRTFGARPQTF